MPCQTLSSPVTPNPRPFSHWQSDSTDEQSANSDFNPPPISFFQLFTYSTYSERFLMAIAIVGAVIHGAILPIFTIIFGAIVDVFRDYRHPMDASRIVTLDDITSEVGKNAKWFIILGAVSFFSSFAQVHFQLIFAQSVCNRLRRLYFASLLRQDCAWYDNNEGGELTARVAGDVHLIEAGIGDKITTGVQYMSTLFTGIIVALLYSWRLTLVVFSIAPFIVVTATLFGTLSSQATSSTQGAYGAAGAVASEVISQIKTVTSYNGQESEAKRYEKHLEAAYKLGVKKAVFSGIALGSTYFVMFAALAVAFSYGASQVRKGSISPGDVVITFFSVFVGISSFGQATPSYASISEARGAAPRVYEIINRKSDIDPMNKDEGIIPDEMKGNIKFSNVRFNYPSRLVSDMDAADTRKHVLDDFNLEIPAGSNHVLVGGSGCGKSTVVRLIERFYDVQAGQVTIDGIDVREFNVRWLRSQMGYVGQLPTLFMLSIRDNIALGAPLVPITDSETGNVTYDRKEVSDEEVMAVCKKANAHDFIMKLPKRYDTLLGERGALLSGGQKQRICIARALIRNPKILLLDEATSALDSRSEELVQKALENATAGRTTITIAHRLSTVKNADTISVIHEGEVVESGNHDTLIDIEGGAYQQLVEYQNIYTPSTSEEEEITADEYDDAIFTHVTESVHRMSVPRLLSEVLSKNIAGSLTKMYTSTQQDEYMDDKIDEDVDRGVLKRAFYINAGEMHLMILGIIGACMAGVAFPLMAYLFSSMTDVLISENSSDKIREWSLKFVALGVGTFIGYFLQYAMLGISGERLTKKLRAETFRAILRQDMSFFDSKQNSMGQLTMRLATEATLVQGITGSALGGLAFISATVISGFLIAFLSCWRVALVVSFLFPFIALSEATKWKLMIVFDRDSSVQLAEAGSIASEAVDNYSTLASLGIQDFFTARYNEALEGPLENGRKTALMAGLAFGFAESMVQALWAVSFWVGSIFVENGNCEFEDLLKAISGLLFAGAQLGHASLFMPDIGRSKIAATSIFRLIDRNSSIDPADESGVKVGKNGIDGNVSAKNVKFVYPTRPNVAVLRGLSISVESGNTLALVGESGCGKSTIIGLIERFYDAVCGSVCIDGEDIRDYNVRSIRREIGYVSQEPDLLNRSVRENISYGLSQEDGTPVTESVIVKAAKEANAHDFITRLPEGYDTEVGFRGERLSGGQRQRIAIARALVRNPRLLLLDEATSALDAVSERVVQEALDNASQGRTTIAIAHRLSSIKNADMIAVVKAGVVVEKGKHEELLQRKGAYANLVQNQMSEISTK